MYNRTISKPPPGDWVALSACQGMGDVMFPTSHEVAKREQALALCHSCPVKLPCQTYAMAEPWEQNGIWGGLLAEDRKMLRRRRARRTA